MRKYIRRMARALSRLWDAIKAPYYRMKDYLRYRRAVQMADDAHDKDGDRYYVMPTMEGKLMVMDRKNFRNLKRKGYIHKDATMQNAIEECFYYTPKLSNMEPITPHIQQQKFNEYQQWCKAMRMINHFTKK